MGLLEIVAEDGISLARRVSCYYGKFFPCILIANKECTCI